MNSKHFALGIAAALLAGVVAVAGDAGGKPPAVSGDRSESRDDSGMMRKRWGHGPSAVDWGDRHNPRGDWRGAPPPLPPGRGPGGPGCPCMMMVGGRGMGGGMMGRPDRDGRDDDMPGMMHRGFGFGPRMWDRLDLTADQKAKMLDLAAANFRAGMENRMAMMDARRTLRDLERNDSAAGDEIIAANRALGEAKGKAEVQRRKFFDDMRSVLTPEQRGKLQDMRDDMRGPGPRRDRFGDRDRDDDGRPDRGMRGPRGMKMERER